MQEQEAGCKSKLSKARRYGVDRGLGSGENMAVIIGSWSWYVCEVHQPNYKDLGNGRFLMQECLSSEARWLENETSNMLNVPESRRGAFARCKDVAKSQKVS